MASLVRLIDLITRNVGVFAAWLTAPLILAMVWEVFSRYALDAPTFWAFEIGYMLMGASLLLGIAYAVQMRAHVRVNFLYDSMPARGQALVDLLGFVLLLPVVVWMTWGLWNYLAEAYANGEVSGESAWIPVVWPFRMTFFVGFALFALQVIIEVIACVYTLAGKAVPGRPLPEVSTNSEDPAGAH